MTAVTTRFPADHPWPSGWRQVVEVHSDKTNAACPSPWIGKAIITEASYPDGRHTRLENTDQLVAPPQPAARKQPLGPAGCAGSAVLRARSMPHVLSFHPNAFL